jgi:hypothetical protein
MGTDYVMRRTLKMRLPRRMVKTNLTVPALTIFSRSFVLSLMCVNTALTLNRPKTNMLASFNPSKLTGPNSQVVPDDLKISTQVL